MDTMEFLVKRARDYFPQKSGVTCIVGSDGDIKIITNTIYGIDVVARVKMYNTEWEVTQ